MEVESNCESVTFKENQFKCAPEAISRNIESSNEQERMCDTLSIHNRKFNHVLDSDNEPYSSKKRDDSSMQCVAPVPDCLDGCTTFLPNSLNTKDDSNETIKACDSPDAFNTSETFNMNLCAHSPSGVQECPKIEECSVPEDFSNLDKRRTRRSCKRKKESDLCCPICGLTVRLPELGSHFAQEVEKLSKIPKSLKKPPRDDSGINTSFVQVKSNRQNRLTAKVAAYAAKDTKEIQCPVCKIRMHGCVEDIDNHVAQCVQNDENSDELINVDDDDDDSFEEYEIGDQTRIRTISLVPGGHRALEGQTARRCRLDEDEDLDVDVDDTMAFGEPQYTELDVIPNQIHGDDEASERLRKAVLVDPTAQPQILESRKWLESNDSKEDIKEKSENSKISQENDVLPTATKEEVPTDHVVSSLKEKIKDLEDERRNVRCLICMEPYTKPVVSTTCWHVHCEECWLMTMGVKKLCPQCNMIVFPSDLRKIYL